MSFYTLAEDIPSNRHAAALAFKNALLHGTVKIDTFLSHVSMGLTNEDLLVCHMSVLSHAMLIKLIFCVPP